MTQTTVTITPLNGPAFQIKVSPSKLEQTEREVDVLKTQGKIKNATFRQGK